MRCVAVVWGDLPFPPRYYPNAGMSFATATTGRLWLDGPDPAAIAGEPRAIRSDEWYVQTVWTVSQVQLGLPIGQEGGEQVVARALGAAFAAPS